MAIRNGDRCNILLVKVADPDPSIVGISPATAEKNFYNAELTANIAAEWAQFKAASLRRVA